MSTMKWVAFLLMAASVLAGCQLESWVWIQERGVVIQHVGVPIQPEPEISPIARQGTAKTTGMQRPLAFQISADYPEGELTPEKILVDNQIAVPGEPKLTGTHTYRIEKSGYYSLQGGFEIPEGAGTWILVRKMVCKPRRVQFDIRDSASSDIIAPDKVLVGAQLVKHNDEVKPAETMLEIHKSGYQSILEAPFNLPVGEGPYTLSRKMVSAQVELKFVFTNAKTGEAVVADSILLGNKPTADGSYAQPGTYELKVKKQSFKTYITSVQIPGNVRRHEIAAKLEPSDIPISWKVFGDYPGDEIVPSLVLIDGKATKENSIVAPGPHTLTIKDAPYQTLTEEIMIPENIDKYYFEKTLISLPRTIEFSILYDVKPPKNMAFYQIELQKLDTGDTIPVKGGEKIKPGTYEVKIAQTAYSPVAMNKRIFPGVTPYQIEVKLVAKNRTVNAKVEFDIVPPTDLGGHTITFIDVETNIRRAVTSGGNIKPGKYNYVIEKPSYKMVGGTKLIDIEPSEEVFNIEEKMVAETRQLSFNMEYKGTTVPAKNIKIDNEKYTFENRYIPGRRYKAYAQFEQYEDIEVAFEVTPGVGPFVVNMELKPKSK